MGKVSVLNTAGLESSLQGMDLGNSGCLPVSLLAFLQAENLRLRTRVAELQEDTTALREELKHN
jgi:hypothetical protein